MKTKKNERKFSIQKQKVSAKATMFGVIFFMLVGLIISTTVVSAYRGDYSVKGPEYNEERHTEMERAFETLDYDSWNDLMTQNGRHPRVVDVVNENNFELFVKAHEAGESGDYETAAKIRAELGLNDGQGPKDGTGYGKSQGRGKELKQSNFVDADKDGICDNAGSRQGKGRR